MKRSFYSTLYSYIFSVSITLPSKHVLQDVASSVRASSRNGHKIPHRIDNEERPVQFFNWMDFLKQCFFPLKNITKYQSFKVSAAAPGTVL